LAYREIKRPVAISKIMSRPVAAMQQVLPTLSRKEVSAEAVNAIAYATKYHSEWFWKGAQHVRKWRTTH